MKRPHNFMLKVLIGMLFFLSIFPSFAQTIIDIPITSSAADAGDDAEERVSNGNMDLTSSDLELYNEISNNRDQYVGIRFQGVNVPQGATISNAYIQFDVDEATSGAVTINIVGIDVDNAAQFTNTNYNISQRIDGTISSRTSATQNWFPADWNTVGANGVDQQTNDIKNIVEEIVSRSGWSSGNAMAFVFRAGSGGGNSRIAEDGDNPGHRLSLHIEYSMIPKPEINIIGNGTKIYDGNTVISTLDNTDFGAVLESSGFVSRTFTIENAGSLDLTLNNPSPYVILTGDIADFTLTTPPSTPIASGGSTTFTITFDPTSVATKTATISIANNDSNENPYTFDIQGKGIVPNLINAGEDWSYLDDGSDQGTAWYSLPYDYSSWAQGPAELGYGDGDEATVVGFIDTDLGTGGTQKNITTYFKKSFNVSGIDLTNGTLVLNAIRDDGMIVYVNGVQVWRDNMPAVYDYTTLSTVAVGVPSETTWQIYKIKNVLVSGTNEVSVEIHQTNNTSSDISFNFYMYTNNDYVFDPPPAPDLDVDLIADYIDSDDDNDGVTDILEGCYTVNFEGLNSTGVTSNEEDIRANFPILNHPMDDGNTIDFSLTGTFNRITSYYAGEHGWAVRVRGANTLGTMTLNFGTPVENLFFKLVDFDENETWTVNAYDDSNNLIDLTTSNNVYELGSYIEQVGNTFNDRYLGLNTNNNGDRVSSDVYGSVYFYFPGVKISRLEFIINQPDGSTIRLAAMHFCGLDTDGDGIGDYNDYDSDNDAIPDLVEAGGYDADGNGVVDDLTDTDQDGLVDIYDSTPNVYFAEEVTTILDLDFDGDGVKNRIDLDSDNDGIVDLREAGQPDTDGNGQIDGFTDVNSDGYHDPFDGAGSVLMTATDTNADGIPETYSDQNLDGVSYPNFMDLDSDNDGITDNTEAQATGAYISLIVTDIDGDGIPNVFDNSGSWGGNGLIPEDTDADGTPDYLDLDSDDSEEPDIVEGHDTTDSGTGDSGSNAANGVYIGSDVDNDGLDDGFDNNNATFDPTNGNLQPNSHPIIDAGTDRDWRFSLVRLDFDGNNDYVDFDNEHAVNSSFSLEGWILQHANVANGTIISKTNVKSGSERGYRLSLKNNYPNLTWYNNAGTKVVDISSSFPINNSRWHHIAATYDGTTAKLYVDGIEMATIATSDAPLTTSEKCFVGAMYDSDTPTVPKNHFYGYIDEVRVWNIELSVQQLHEMMNQEIEQNGIAVRGKIVPRAISGGLLWTNLEGYYPMTNDKPDDYSSYARNGKTKNITTIQIQTAPIPYITIRDGDWTNRTNGVTPWLYGATVWDYPNAIGIDGTTPIDWNIVVSSHNITSGDKNIRVLGLISDTPNTELTIADPNESQDETNTGQALSVSRYLRLDGMIDLVGESQLLQDDDSWLDEASLGYIEKDQQGIVNSFAYNYWSAPVSKIGAGSNNTPFTIAEILTDGTDSNNPQNIDFGPDAGYYYADGGVSNPIKIASAWIWKLVNKGNDYAQWEFLGKDASTLNVTEGYTMKGVDGTGVLDMNIQNQNYVYQGKPNNVPNNASNFEMIHTTFPPLVSGNPYVSLAGNPFPSALDADQFLADNAASTDATLYFWEHWSNGTHEWAQYQGGYAIYKSGGNGVPAVTHADISSGGTSRGTPRDYVPVGQGFYVISSAAGGDVVFKNSQRIFEREIEHGGTSSVFIKGSNTKKEETNKITTNKKDVMRIRLGIESPDGFHRQILAAFFEGPTDEIDHLYDGKSGDFLPNDAFFLQEDQYFVIQAFGEFDENREIPISVFIDENNNGGIQKFMIDGLENVPENVNIFIKDNHNNGITYDIKNSSGFETPLETGEHKDRFSLVFKSNTLSVDEENFIENKVSIFMRNSSNEIVIQRTLELDFKQVFLFNSLGQLIKTWNKGLNEQNIGLPVDVLAGVYIVSIDTKQGIITKKLLI